MSKRKNPTQKIEYAKRNHLRPEKTNWIIVKQKKKQKESKSNSQ